MAVTPWRDDDEMVALLPASWEAPEAVTPEWAATRRWACFAPGTQMHGSDRVLVWLAGFNLRPFLALSYRAR